MIYSYVKEANLDNLENEIKNSEITIALNGITLTGIDGLDVDFKTNISELEKDLLDEIILNHDHTIPSPKIPSLVELSSPKDANGSPIFRNSPFSDTGGFRFRGSSFKDSVPSNSTKAIDFQIVEERWINGGQLIIDNIGSEDRASFQVVDKDYLYAGILYPANFNGIEWSVAQPNGVVLDEFIKEYYIPEDKKLEISLAYPARVLAGLYIRLIYTSTSDGCNVKCNLYLHWKSA